MTLSEFYSEKMAAAQSQQSQSAVNIWKKNDYLLLLRDSIVPKWVDFESYKITYGFLNDLFETAEEVAGNHDTSAL